jgi:4-azaleucine resistance transporter AzlC
VFILVDMRTFWRTLEPGTLRDIGMVCLADALVGVSFGALAVAGGLRPWVPVVMSLVVFAGGAQIAAVGVVLAGGGPLAAVVAGLVLNTRMLPYGFAVADQLGNRWWTRLAGAHLVVDETVAFVSAQPDPHRRRAVFWICGAALFACWNAAVVVGALAGTVIANTGAFGLDAAFPAVLLALVLPSLTERGIRNAALLGAVVAVAATPFLPAGIPPLLALAGLALLWRPRAAAPGAARPGQPEHGPVESSPARPGPVEHGPGRGSR